MSYYLGVDLGTTYTAAAIWRKGQVEVCQLGMRAAVVPSVLLLRDDGRLLVGEAAERRAASEPQRVAREFKRRMGDPTPIILAGTPYSADALSARLLDWVVDKISQVEGARPDRVAVCHPANWGAFKIDLLHQAIETAGIDQAVAVTLSEPEAAAIHYASQERVAPGSVVAVYDLGGGTFDSAVLRKTERGWSILGQPHGIERLGGVDFDAAVFEHVRSLLGEAVETLDPEDPGAQSALSRLRQECVAAKEALSSDTDATIPVLLPSVHTSVRLTRQEFEQMVRPRLVDSVGALHRALQTAGVTPEQIDTVLLVGGSSRVPLVAQEVGSELRRPVAVDAHPKYAIALGAAILAAQQAHVAQQAQAAQQAQEAQAAQQAQRAQAGQAALQAGAAAAATGAGAATGPPSPTRPAPPAREPLYATPVATSGPPPPGAPNPAGAGTSPFAPRGTPTTWTPSGTPAAGRTLSPRVLLALAAALVLGIVVAAVVTSGGGDGDDDGVTAGDDEPGVVGAGDPEANAPGEWTPAGELQQGGEVVDTSTFASGEPQYIDPLLAIGLGEGQIANALYDGLTAVDYSDPQQPTVKGAVAAEWTSNAESTVWTFTIRDGLKFSDGSEVLPSSFELSWEIGSDPAMAETAGYSHLYGLIEGGQARMDGEADSISGVEANDEDMTLTVTLAQPHAQFDMVVSHQVFSPMPEARSQLSDQTGWQSGPLVGNGPFVLDEPFSPRADLVLVPNPEWNGDAYAGDLGLPPDPYLEKITFRQVTDPEVAFRMLESGEADVAPVPPSSFSHATENYEIDLEQPALGIYFFQINLENNRLGGEENRLLRQAISQAVDREEINDVIYEGTKSVPTGFSPPGVEGFEEGLCDFCEYDQEAAQAAFQEWQDAGNSLDGALEIQINQGFGHEAVAEIIVDNLREIGIDATVAPLPAETYFQDMAEGQCGICRSGWFADLPTYDSFLFEQFHSDAQPGSNFGFSNSEFDTLLSEARAETDPAARVDLYHQAERVLLNDQIAVIPIYWYSPLTVHDPERIANFRENPDFDIAWETVALAQ